MTPGVFVPRPSNTGCYLSDQVSEFINRHFTKFNYANGSWKSDVPADTRQLVYQETQSLLFPLCGS